MLVEISCRKRPFHVGNLRLQALFANLRKVPGFIYHAALHAAHPKSARLAGVLRAHSLPQSQRTDFHGPIERVSDRLPAASWFGFSSHIIALSRVLMLF